MIIDFSNLNIWQWIFLGIRILSFILGLFLIGKKREAEVRKGWESLLSLVGIVLVLLAFGIIR